MRMTKEEFENIPTLEELKAVGISGKTNFGIPYRSSSSSVRPQIFERFRIPNGVETKIKDVTFINGAS